MNKDTVTKENINIYCDKHKQSFNEMNHIYRSMISLNITDELILKPKDHVYIIMMLWKELNLPVIPSAHLFEDHIIF